MKIDYPINLPVSQQREKILQAIKTHQVIVVSGETGSGKSTQIPKMCYELLIDRKGTVGCTQPRRIAALTVSARVAEELGKEGRFVGSKIRFQDNTDDNTKIKFMTDGILLAETRSDVLLQRYEILIIDEAHERSLNIDFLLGYLKRILPQRPDLKIIITSATIDTNAFSHHFGNAPIVPIEGKTYPIQLRYEPPVIDELGEQENYIDHCINTIIRLHRKEPNGDILAFLPTEKDIRTCCGMLKKKMCNIEILPLFGRLHPSDQKKIFIPYKKTKIVVATNVAETSITVPGIRYVVDTGLARMSYYNFKAKTDTLPIQKISQASCNQRKGRCGRIGPGICIRLFAEEDYQSREQFSIPEIQRSNLAEVILQMLYFNLGNPSIFPFIDPPHPSAIQDGYRLLHELSALDEKGQLTSIGRNMASMPIDPCISRIIIEAQKNNCLKEIKIIASALAIQDPRVRPAELEKSADLAHKIFADPQSDFLSLLNIWNLFHSVKTKTSWSRLKKFCKTHFLSFQRMREWIDLHDQMSKILQNKPGFGENSAAASYDAIHNTLTIGYLRNIAVKKQDKLYQGASGKEVMIFPGSDQFSKSSEWIVAASFLETNRLYAHTVAAINVDWLESLAGNLCKYSWSSPRFQKRTGQVTADERVSLFGLVIVAARTVNFGRTNSKNQVEARKIFIQSALVEGQLGGSFPFLKKNLECIKKWQDYEDRLRSRNILVHDAELYLIYDRKLPENVYDSYTLRKFLKKKSAADQLILQENEILNREPVNNELAEFPSILNIGSQSYSLAYEFDPLSSADGVTVKIPFDLAAMVRAEIFEWLVPGLIKEKTIFLLRSLPKKIRKLLIPISQTADWALDDIEMYKGSFYSALEKSIHKQHKIHIKRSDWTDQLPPHLTMRFSLLDAAGKEVAAGRDLRKLITDSAGFKPDSSPLLRSSHVTLMETWENFLTHEWDFATLPEKLPLFSRNDQVAGYLYPALTPVPGKGGVTVSFHTSAGEASRHNRIGLQYVYRLQFVDQYKTLKKFCTTTLSGPSSVWYIHNFASKADAVEKVLGFVIDSLFGTKRGILPNKEQFDQKVAEIRKKNLYISGTDIINATTSLLRLRKQVYDRICYFETLAEKSKSYSQKRYLEYHNLLTEILPGNFLSSKQCNEFSDIERYLQSLIIRIERAHIDFSKDEKKAQVLIPLLKNLDALNQNGSLRTEECSAKIHEYEKMVQEMRISVFSPEIKTKYSVSIKKIMQFWEKFANECL